MKAQDVTKLAALACAIASAVAAPIEKAQSAMQHERREVEHSAWVKRSRLNSSHVVPVRIGLTQSNLENGEAKLLEISNPSSPEYGKHLSPDEVVDLFAPAAHRVDAVKAWIAETGLVGHGSVSLSNNKQWLQFNAPVLELETLLQTQYHEYEHSSSGANAIGCDEYHLPSYIQEHVDYITPGVKHLKLRPERSTVDLRKRDEGMPGGTGGGKVHPIIQQQIGNVDVAASGDDCGFAISPDCIRRLYNVTDTIPGQPGNSLGIYEEGLELYNQTDLNEYFATFAPEIPQGSHPQFDPVDGAPPPSNATYPGTEADLDFEAAYPFVYPDEIVNFQVDDYHYATNSTVRGLFNTLLDAIDGSYCTYSAFGETGNDPTVDPTYPDPALGGYNAPLQCGRYSPTNVISISYSEDETDLPLNYQRRQCNEFMKLGLQGVSFIVSSGDSGVAPRAGQCLNGNTAFGPQNPINCPYITAVGGTVLPPGGVAGQTKETATTSFGSSGGFSNIYPSPDYQASALAFFFTNYPPPYDFYNTTLNETIGPGLYNRAGRAYPDVAATGQNFAGFVFRDSDLISGTSVSTPVFAALVTRINSLRLNAGKGPVGFLNPTLYQHPEIFNDIVTGNNPGCGTSGFECVPGWDPVTGLGTPNYGLMRDLFLSLP